MEEALLDLLPGAPVYHLGLYRYVPTFSSSTSSPSAPSSLLFAVNDPHVNIPPLLLDYSLAIARASAANNQRSNLPPSNRILLPPPSNHKRRPYLHPRSNGSYWKHSTCSNADDERVGPWYGKGLFLGDYWE
jgi:hypothetical protein